MRGQIITWFILLKANNLLPFQSLDVLWNLFLALFSYQYYYNNNTRYYYYYCTGCL